MGKEEFGVGKAPQLLKLRKESRTPTILPILSSLNAGGGTADPVDVEACVEAPAAKHQHIYR
jgi:hypothetical protein